ncbi:hypothetical protein R0I01_11670 [Bacillus pumilus]|nr:hypothetical protein R0I01_11670 [Bacillus pumilus]
MAYILQENGYDTVEANEALGLIDDTRQYEEAHRRLQHLVTQVSLITIYRKNKGAIPCRSIFWTHPLWVMSRSLTKNTCRHQPLRSMRRSKRCVRLPHNERYMNLALKNARAMRSDLSKPARRGGDCARMKLLVSCSHESR